MAKRTPATPRASETESVLSPDPQWYKDAVIYQLHVRSYSDSDNDGIGDFRGLTQKLDYLQDLGVTALWILPFYPSPLRDDGYDIADYTSVNPSYGTLKDFKHFVAEAHARGLRVITELVVNHTSDQHPWFQRARRAKPGSPARDFYVWSDTPEKYQEARIIFKDFETSNWSWDPIAKAYYWHRFYSHQPDLNFENPHVHEAVMAALDYWLSLGVDGLRLDAVPYLYEREGTNCENLPQTHDFLKKLRKRVDDKFPGRMLLAEANQWPEDAIAYFGEGDECQTAFHFPLMPRLFMAIHMEDRFPIVDILQQTPAIPESCQWIIFLRNHDELTLEMVTDEERDYMYRVYARDRQARINLGIRRRLAPLLNNNRRKIELMNGLLCSMPGTPVIYYGDEIGMGDNIYLGDRHGVRTPMQWSPDRNAGFSGANPQRLYSPVIIDSEYLFESVNVENQQKNPHSLLWWMKRLIALRQHYAALARGSLEILSPENPKILAFTRSVDQQSVLVVANMSRFVQYVEIDLSRFAGQRPIEMFGQTKFPTIGKLPYMLTLPPHGFYWFALEIETAATTRAEAPHEPARMTIPEGALESMRGRLRRRFEQILVRELPRRSWFTDRAELIQNVSILDTVHLGKADVHGGPRLLLVRVEYLEGEPELMLLPIGLEWGETAQHRQAEWPASVLANMVRAETKETGVSYDASGDPQVFTELFALIARRRRLKSTRGELVGWSTPALAEPAGDRAMTIREVAGAQASEAIVADQAIMKVYHAVEPGVHPAVEIGRHFSGNGRQFEHSPPLVGSIEYRSADHEAITAAIVHQYVPNTTSGWQFARDTLGRFIDEIMAQPPESRPTVPVGHTLVWDRALGEAPPLAKDLLGGFLEWAALLGRRTGELHVALANDHGDANFTPEPFSQFYQRSLYQTSRQRALEALHQLRGAVKSLPEEVQSLASRVLAVEKQVVEIYRSMLAEKIEAPRIRVHGDYHLGNVLYTGKDLLIVNFDGESELSLAARRLKRSPLKDVACMIHSFYFAASRALTRLPKTGVTTPETVAAWRQAAQFWYQWSSSAFVRAYIHGEAATLLPADRKHLNLLLRVHLLDKAMQELQVELAHHPEWIRVPLERTLELLAD